MSCAVFDLKGTPGEPKKKKKKKPKPAGTSRTVLLAKVDGIPEIRPNLRKIIDQLKLPDLNYELQIVGDMKAGNFCTGIFGLDLGKVSLEKK